MLCVCPYLLLEAQGAVSPNTSWNSRILAEGRKEGLTGTYPDAASYNRQVSPDSWQRWHLFLPHEKPLTCHTQQWDKGCVSFKLP